MMQFANPEAFLLFLLLPISIGYRLSRSEPLSSALALPTYPQVSTLRQPWLWKLWLPRLLTLLSVILLIVALARPRTGREVVRSRARGVDIILALDTSGSMLAEDFQPNRFEAARRVILDFIRSQRTNRVGMVVFAGRSFTLLPLTTDYGLFLEAVRDINPQTIKIDGTAIGDGIANAVYRFRKDNLKSRVLVLLTDGENTAGNIKPLVAAQVARQRNVKIYTIGMGKAEGIPIPLRDPRTGQRFYARDRNGNLYLSRINSEELKQIATITGGQYFQADNAQKLNTIYQKIARMEQAEFEVKRTTQYQEQMAWFVFPALILLALAMALELTLARVLRV